MSGTIPLIGFGDTKRPDELRTVYPLAFNFRARDEILREGCLEDGFLLI
jgi:hypothetical protein